MESVAIYCRLSKDDGDDAESNSIKSQKMILQSYCSKLGWAIYDTYVDDGYSGTNFDRPAFQRMHQDIVDAKVNVVISKDLSRLGRNYILTGYYYQVFFPEAGVRYIAVNDHIDTENERNDMAMAAFKNIMNDLHSKQLSKNIHAARRARIENKHNCNGMAPYGYFFNAEHVLEPDPNTAPFVKFIFDEYVKRPTAGHVATLLNEQGVPSRGANLLHNGRYQNGKIKTNWHRSEVIQVIKHPAYMGAISTATRKKCNPYSQKTISIPFKDQEIIYDCHEAIVTRDLWEKANALLVEIGHKLCGYKQEEKGIYYGLLFCAHCGKMLESQRHNNYMYIFCRCWPPDIGMSSRGVTNKIISRHLIAEIRKMALVCENEENSAYSFIQDHINSERNKTRVEIEIDMNAARKRIEILNDKITNFEKYTSNKSLQQKEKDTIYGALCATLKDEEHNVEVLKQSDDVIPSVSDLYQFVRVARRYGYVQVIERPVVDDLIDRIYITKKMNLTNNQQDRILVKYKHVGMMSGIYRSRAIDKRNSCQNSSQTQAT